jgi:hypothetical protein
MSAFVVSVAHLDALAHAGLAAARSTGDSLRWLDRNGNIPTLTFETAEQTGAMLRAENVRSVNHRYDPAGPGLEPGYAFTRKPFKPDPVVILKALHCYEYQSCETDDWAHSEAARFCIQLRTRMIRRLPGYDSARWDITQVPPARLVDALIHAGLAPGRTRGNSLRWLDRNGNSRTLTLETAEQTGAMLCEAYPRTVEDRNDDATQPVYTFTWKPCAPDPVEILQALESYEDRARRTDEWTHTEAATFCDQLCSRMTQLLPGYDDAPWELTHLAQARIAPHPAPREPRSREHR